MKDPYTILSWLIDLEFETAVQANRFASEYTILWYYIFLVNKPEEMLHLCSENVVKILRWQFIWLKCIIPNLRQIVALALSHVFGKHKMLKWSVHQVLKMIMTEKKHHNILGERLEDILLKKKSVHSVKMQFL